MIKTEKKFWFSLILALLLSFGLAMPAFAGNAFLYLSPPSGTYTVGSTFSVQVKVNSEEKAINAAEGTLTFNPTELQVVNISKSGSIFTLWTTEPTFSNSIGNIIFGGGTPYSFSGTPRVIMTITFEAEANASAQVAFSSGSVLAADGKGTNILGNMQGGLYILQSKIVIPSDEEFPSEEVTPEGTPATPVVSSNSHSDPDKWYSNNDLEFSWEVPPDVTEMKLLISKVSTAIPTIVYSPPISEKKVEDLTDGVWYFHIRFKNEHGWGRVLHRKVLIDATAPNPFEIEVQREDLTDPQPILIFETTDKTSGIKNYEIKIGEGEPFSAEEIKGESYKLPPQAPGEHSIEVRALDKAGNYTLASTEIEVLSIEAPNITKFPTNLSPGQNLFLEGRSLPEATIRVFIQKENTEPIMSEATADKEGKWSFISPEPLENGEYETWVEAQDEKEALSLPSQKISFWVGLPPLLKFGKIAIDYLSVMITLVILIAFLIGIILYAWYRVSLWRNKLRVETKEVKRTVTQAFKLLQENVQEQIENLDKKPGLTKGEKEVRDKLQRALNISKEFIRKEIKDIEKKLE